MYSQVELTGTSSPCWLIYAPGGGWGHLVRSLSLARAVASKYAVKVISNSHHISTVVSSDFWKNAVSGPDIEIIDLRKLLQGNSPDALKSVIAGVLTSTEYSHLIVDTFPRGIAGELIDLLPLLKMKHKIFIHRDLNPEYVEKFELGNFVETNYDLVLNPGEKTVPPLTGTSFETAAWLIKSAHEILERDEILKRLQIENLKERLFLLVCSSGLPGEQSLFTDLAKKIRAQFPHLIVRCISSIAGGLDSVSANGLEKDESKLVFQGCWPGIDFIAAADIVVGAGGYNTINECRAVGVPLIVLPQKRLYDRQLQRAISASFLIAETIDDVFAKVEEVATSLKSAVQSRSSAATSERVCFYENGVYAAFSEIEKATVLRFEGTGSP